MRDSDLTHECQVSKTLNGCDHHLIRLKIKRSHELIENKSKIPDYRRANFDLARDMLTQTIWEPVNFTAIDGAWNGFKCKLLEVERKSFPMETRRANSSVTLPWITSQVRQAIILMKKRYNFLERNNTGTVSSKSQSFQNLNRQRCFSHFFLSLAL